jgi:hypothetical protein
MGKYNRGRSRNASTTCADDTVQSRAEQLVVKLTLLNSTVLGACRCLQFLPFLHALSIQHVGGSVDSVFPFMLALYS